MPDVAVHLLVEGLDELIHLAVGAFHDDFDAAVGEVADVTGDVVLEGEVLGGVAEANALNAAIEETRAAVQRDAGLGLEGVHGRLI